MAFINHSKKIKLIFLKIYVFYCINNVRICNSLNFELVNTRIATSPQFRNESTRKEYYLVAGTDKKNIEVLAIKRKYLKNPCNIYNFNVKVSDDHAIQIMPSFFANFDCKHHRGIVALKAIFEDKSNVKFRVLSKRDVKNTSDLYIIPYGDSLNFKPDCSDSLIAENCNHYFFLVTFFESNIYYFSFSNKAEFVLKKLETSFEHMYEKQKFDRIKKRIMSLHIRGHVLNSEVKQKDIPVKMKFIFEQ